VNTLAEAETPESGKAIWDYVCSPERLDEVLRAEPIDAEVLDTMLESVGEDAIDPMLDVLAESESQQTRRVLLDRIVKLGPAVGPLALKRLEDPRWFVQRNALAILGELPEPPPGFDAAKYIQNADARVRRESLKISLRVDEGRDRAVCAALADKDPRTVRMGLSAASESCPVAAVPLLVKMATAKLPDEIRVAAVNVLGECGHPSALDALIQMTAPKKTLLGLKLPQKSKMFLAALSALRNCESDTRAEKVLAAAKKARDPEIVRAATGVDGGGK
jgi:HEAT repeat protein